MLYFTTVTQWSSDRDSKGRVGAKDRPLGRHFLINTDRITDLTAMDTQTTGGSFSKFTFTENPGSRRESKDYLEVMATVHEIEHGHNTVPASLLITLPVFKDNNSSKATVNTTVKVADIIYADYDNANHTHSWVLYIKDGFKKARVLVNLSLVEILDLVSNPLLDYDGNLYTTTVIGSQEWTIQNLRVTHYSTGVAIPYIEGDAAWQAAVTGAYCYYNHDPANGRAYGNLYNWYVANDANIAYFTRNGVQEAGWRVPTMADWTTLATALGGVLVAGDKLRETGTLHWIGGGGTDNNEFRSLGNGNRFVDSMVRDGFYSLKIFNDMWSSEAHSATDGDSVYCYPSSPGFTTYNWDKFGGMAIRCVRDV